MASKLDNLTKFELEANIKTGNRWLGALKRGTFCGDDCQAIAMIVGFFEKEVSDNLKEYEAKLGAHPEWGRDNSITKVEVAA